MDLERLRKYLIAFGVIEVVEDITDEELEIELLMADNFLMDYVDNYDVELALLHPDLKTERGIATIIAYQAFQKLQNIGSVSLGGVSRSLEGQIPLVVLEPMQRYFPMMFKRRLMWVAGC